MKKKLAAILISLALMLSVTLGFVPAAQAVDYSIVHVKLSVGTPTEIPVTLNGNYTANGEGTFSGACTVKLEDNVIKLYKDADVAFEVSCAEAPDATLTLTPTVPDCDTISLYNEHYKTTLNYLGEFEFSISETYLQVINTLNLEKYLYGVVPHEMSDSWPLEALKAQAITARNYAVNRAPGLLGDTSNNQVYKGYDPSKTNAINAVDSTAGMVLKCGDGFIENCYYSASNGGYTDIPQHRWTASAPLLPYHVMQVDEYDVANPYSRQETITIPKSSPEGNIQYDYNQDGKSEDERAAIIDERTALVNSRLSHYLRLCALPAVSDKGFIAKVTDDISIVSIDNIVPHTYETEQLAVNDYEGKNLCEDFVRADVTMTVKAKHFAAADGDSLLLGDVDMNGEVSVADYTHVRLHILGKKALEGESLLMADVDRSGSVSVADYTYIRLHILNLKPITSRTTDMLVEDTTTVTVTIDLNQLDANGGPYQSFFDLSLSLTVVREDDTNWYICQRRWGHGIGMSQRGAQQRALDGHTYVQILEFYYPNTEIVTLYQPTDAHEQETGT